MKLKSKNLKWLSRIMTVLMLFTLVPNVLVSNANALENERGTSSEYEIYPIPQNVEYGDTNLSLGTEVNVVVEENIDDATINRLLEVLSIKGINHEVSNEIKEGKTNFLIGIHNSNGVVDNYFTENNYSPKQTV